MKKITNASALILSALMLFGCASNSANGGVGDTTPPSESSVTESKNESSGESSATENSSVTDNTSKESEENLVKNIEGYQTFSYDSSVYEITNDNKFKKRLISPYDFEDSFEPNYTNLKRFMRAPVVVKCHVVGDSYFILEGKCGDVEFNRDERDKGVYTCIYTPVIIDEIIDDFGVKTDYNTGDIVYVMEDYILTESYNNNKPLEWLDKSMKDMEKVIENNSDNYLAEQFGEVLESDKKYRDYLTSHQTVISTRTVLLEKGQSYLMIFDEKARGFVFDNNQYAANYTVTFDLENDAPKVYMSEEEDADYFNGYYRYRDQWKYLKEKYGEHFKS